MIKLNLTSGEISTIRTALSAWATRCNAEAKQMDGWMKEFQAKGDAETAAQCNRNAEASRRFKADADSLNAKI